MILGAGKQLRTQNAHLVLGNMVTDTETGARCFHRALLYSRVVVFHEDTTRAEIKAPPPSLPPPPPPPYSEPRAVQGSSFRPRRLDYDHSVFCLLHTHSHTRARAHTHTDNVCLEHLIGLFTYDWRNCVSP